MNIINKMVWTIQRSQPGGWNDLDMLEVGNVCDNVITMELARIDSIDSMTDVK